MAEYRDEQGITYESYTHYFLTYLLNFCTCYNDELGEDIIKVLLVFNDDNISHYIDTLEIQPLTYAELILHNLEHAELLEHGTSIRGSWLTDKGREVAAALKVEMSEEDNDA